MRVHRRAAESVRLGGPGRGAARLGCGSDCRLSREQGDVELVELEDRLSELFGRSVDLLTENGISPYLKDEILTTTSVLFDEG